MTDAGHALHVPDKLALLDMTSGPPPRLRPFQPAGIVAGLPKLSLYLASNLHQGREREKERTEKREERAKEEERDRRGQRERGEDKERERKRQREEIGGGREEERRERERLTWKHGRRGRRRQGPRIVGQVDSVLRQALALVVHATGMHGR